MTEDPRTLSLALAAIKEGALNALRTFWAVTKFLLAAAAVLAFVASCYYLDHVRFMR